MKNRSFLFQYRYSSFCSLGNLVLLGAFIINVLFPQNQTPITLQTLSQKWELEEYRYFLFTEMPAPKERQDYLHLKTDLTFNAVSEGQKENGQWRLEAGQKRLYLSSKGEAGELVLIIQQLSSKHLVLSIDDPEDQDLKALKIYYKNSANH